MSGWAAVAEIANNVGNWALDHWENIRQQHFEHDEAALNRYWQSQETEKARNWQSREWQRQFDALNAYNTPSAQKQRYIDAGVNPWLSQTAVGSGSASPQATPSTTVPSGSKANAPSFPNIKGFDFGDFLLRKSSVDAQNANQRAQSFKTAVEAASMLWKASPKLAKSYLSTAAKQYGQDQDSFNKFEQEFELDMSRKDLENVRLDIDNLLKSEFGRQKAQADLDLIDQQITESVARIGKMASDAEVNDSVIKKNIKECEELGSRIARNFAEAGLFSANAQTVDRIREYYVNSIRNKSMIDFYNRSESQALYNAGAQRRAWMGSSDSQSRNLWNYQQSPEGNYVNALLNGFVKGASPMIPSSSSKDVNVNYNYNP